MSVVEEYRLWNDNAEQISNKTKTLMQKTKSQYNNLLSIAVDEITFDNTIGAINEIDYKFSSMR